MFVNRYPERILITESLLLPMMIRFLNLDPPAIRPTKGDEYHDFFSPLVCCWLAVERIAEAAVQLTFAARRAAAIPLNEADADPVERLTAFIRYIPLFVKI